MQELKKKCVLITCNVEYAKQVYEFVKDFSKNDIDLFFELYKSFNSQLDTHNNFLIQIKNAIDFVNEPD